VHLISVYEQCHCMSKVFVCEWRVALFVKRVCVCVRERVSVRLASADACNSVRVREMKIH